MSRHNRNRHRPKTTTSHSNDINAKLAQTPTVLNDILELKAAFQHLAKEAMAMHGAIQTLSQFIRLLLLSSRDLDSEFYNRAEHHWEQIKKQFPANEVDFRELLKGFPVYEAGPSKPADATEPQGPFDPTDADTEDDVPDVEAMFEGRV
jgi:hypothetical protein